MMEQQIANILHVYHQATAEEQRDGLRWYACAKRSVQTLAIHHELPVRLVCAVVAALSPNNRWERNLKDADLLISAYLRGEHIESVKVCTYNAMRAKAWGILERKPRTHADCEKLLKGQKITCFFQNIMGKNTCTIDGHARNIAYAERLSLSGPLLTIGKREYRDLQAAYVAAGERIGLKAYQLQAITWVAWRRLHNI